MSKKDTIFARRGWLSRQPAALRDSLLAASRRQDPGAGVPIFHVGDDAGGLYGIVTGSVIVMAASPGQAPTAAHVLQAGDWFGHGSLLSGGSRRLSFVTAEPCQLLQLPLHYLRPRVETDSLLASSLAQLADLSNAIAVQSVRDLLIPRAPQRLAAVLLRVTAMGTAVPNHPDGHAISQAQLGEMANISRSQVNRILAGFEQAGWVGLGYHHIAVRNAEALQGFAYADL